jgi:hypothetical protein
MNPNVYIGMKRVAANPMTRGEYNLYRGWQLPADECPDDKGYLVEYLDAGQPNHANHAGYISWAPAEPFEKAYQSAHGNGVQSLYDAWLKLIKASDDFPLGVACDAAGLGEACEGCQ